MFGQFAFNFVDSGGDISKLHHEVLFSGAVYKKIKFQYRDLRF